MDITPIVNALIALIAAVISAFIIPWIQSTVSAAHLDQFEKWTSIAVAAAEQLYPANRQDEKKQYCVEFLKDKGYNANYAEIENAIEAEVLRLHNQLYGSEKKVEEEKEVDSN